MIAEILEGKVGVGGLHTRVTVGDGRLAGLQPQFLVELLEVSDRQKGRVLWASQMVHPEEVARSGDVTTARGFAPEKLWVRAGIDEESAGGGFLPGSPREVTHLFEGDDQLRSGGCCKRGWSISRGFGLEWASFGRPLFEAAIEQRGPLPLPEIVEGEVGTCCVKDVVLRIEDNPGSIADPEAGEEVVKSLDRGELVGYFLAGGDQFRERHKTGTWNVALLVAFLAGANVEDDGVRPIETA